MPSGESIAMPSICVFNWLSKVKPESLEAIFKKDFKRFFFRPNYDIRLFWHGVRNICVGSDRGTLVNKDSTSKLDTTVESSVRRC